MSNTNSPASAEATIKAKKKNPKTLPYFKWYPSDADTDEDFRAMDDREIGFYLRCLNHSWRNCGIPADPAERQRILKVTKGYHDKLWKRVGKKFTPLETDLSRLVNARQERERAEAMTKSESASNSVRTRYVAPTNVDTNVDDSKWERSGNEAPRALTRAESESLSSGSVVSSERRTTGVSVTKAAWEVDEQFAPFVAAYQQAKPNVLPKEFAEAHRPFTALAFEQKLAAVRGIILRVEYGIWNPGQPHLVTAPVKYLQGEWERVIIRPQRRPPPGEAALDEAGRLAAERLKQREARSGNRN